MDDWILTHEPVVRLVAFAGVLLLLGSLERVAPRRPLLTPTLPRWGRNLTLVVLNTLVTRGVALLVPVAAVSTALFVEARGFGLLHAASLPRWASALVAVVLLDLAVYLQHVLFHAAPALWRVHRVHHADLDFDATTGTRFHPIEIVLSMAIKSAAVALIGAPPAAVIAFEVVLNATSMFNHSNLRVPAELDRVVRWLVVTPDMHRVHHSTDPSELNRNFGFNLPWWDRLLGTYKAQPQAGHEGMTIGIEEVQDPARLTLLRLLALPFVDLRHPSGSPRAPAPQEART